MLKLTREEHSMVLTVDNVDGDELMVADAKAFADALLAERGEQKIWAYNGSSRQNYNRIKLFYVRC